MTNYHSLFPGLRLTKLDARRLNPHIQNYNLLNEILLLNSLTIEDVQRMVVLELGGKGRQFVLKRLVGRLKTKERQELLNNIHQCQQNRILNSGYVDGAKPMTSSSTNSPVRVAKASPTGSRLGRKAGPRS